MDRSSSAASGDTVVMENLCRILSDISVSYTHLDVYKRQPYVLPRDMLVTYPGDIFTTKLSQIRNSRTDQKTNYDQ